MYIMFIYGMTHWFISPILCSNCYRILENIEVIENNCPKKANLLKAHTYLKKPTADKSRFKYV